MNKAAQKSRRLLLTMGCVLAAVLASALAIWSHDGQEGLPHEAAVVLGAQAVEPNSAPASAPVSVAPLTTIVVSGKVLDDTREPVPGAVVVARHTLDANTVGADAGVLDVSTSSPTDASGFFALGVRSASHAYVLTAQAKGYAAASVTHVVPQEGLAEIEIVLSRLGSIAGRVVDLAHNPVAFVRLRASAESGTRFEPEALTNESGQFAIVDMPAALYSLSASYHPPGAFQPRVGVHAVPRDAGNDPLKVVLAPGERRDGLEVVLPWRPGPVVAGRVVDEKGQPIQGARVWATYDPESLNPIGMAVAPTDPSGSFRIEYVDEPQSLSTTAAGLMLVAKAENYERGYTSDVEVANMNVEVVLIAAQRGRIEGIVWDGTQDIPVTGADVYLAAIRTDWQDFVYGESPGEAKRRTDGKGRFCIEDLQCGIASVKVYHPDYGVVVKGGIPIRPNASEPVRIVLDGVAGTLEVTFDLQGDVMDSEALLDVACWPHDQGTDAQPITLKRLKELEARDTLPGPLPTRDRIFELSLPAGAYNVVTTAVPLVTDFDKTYGILPGGQELCHEEITVLSGRKTQLEISVGGTASLKGYVQTPPDDDISSASLLAYLIPEGNTDVLAETVDPYFLGGGDTTNLYFCTRLRRLLCEPIIKGKMYLVGIPDGSYTLAVVALEDSGERRIVYKNRITLPANKEVFVAVP